MKPLKLSLSSALLASAVCVPAAFAQEADTQIEEEAQGTPPTFLAAPKVVDLGGGVTLDFYGYIKADFIKDYDFDLGDTTSGLIRIGLPNGAPPGENTREHLRETRIGFNVERDDLFAKFEGDFFGGDSFELRLRHAYVSYAGVMIGQNWMHWMSVDNLARTNDFQGPVGLPFARLPQLRYTWDNGSGLFLSGAIEEDPISDNDVFVSLAAKKEYDWGFLRAAGMWRDTDVNQTRINGWGLNLSSVVTPWQNGKIKANFVTGNGTVDLLTDGWSGVSVYDGDEVPYNAFTVSIEQKFLEDFAVGAAYGRSTVDRASGSETKRLETVHITGWYEATDNIRFGLEYFNGKRHQGDGASFDAGRVQFSSVITF